jgi:hypothetical protein
MGEVAFSAIHKAVELLPSGESISISKSEISHLPPEFRPTILGTPSWIAHPGAICQYRGPHATHAYELSNRFEVHRDERDPTTDPLGHFIIDAPELCVATAAGLLIGGLVYLLAEREGAKRPGVERREWLSVILGIIAGVISWFLFYIIFAMSRVALRGTGSASH